MLLLPFLLLRRRIGEGVFKKLSTTPAFALAKAVAAVEVVLPCFFFMVLEAFLVRLFLSFFFLLLLLMLSSIDWPCCPCCCIESS